MELFIAIQLIADRFVVRSSGFWVRGARPSTLLPGKIEMSDDRRIKLLQVRIPLNCPDE